MQNPAILVAVLSLRDRIGESTGALRGVFANPNLRRVQLAFAGQIVGQYAYSIAVSVYAFQQGGAAAVGIVSFVRLMVAALIAPFAASLADRFHRERVMLASDLVRAALVAAAAMCVFADTPAIFVYVLATLTTIGGTVFRPAEAALLPTLSRTPEELSASNVVSSTFDSLGSFLGPALGGLLLVVAGPGTVIAVMAVCFLWSALLVSRVRPERQPAVERGEQGGLQELTAGFRAVGAEPRLRLLIGLYSAQCVVAGAMGVLVVVVAIDLLEMGNGGVGFLEAASGIGSLLGAAVALALVSRRKVAGDFGLGIILWGAPLVLLGIVPSTAVALLAMAVSGLGNTLVDISGITLLQRTAPEAVAGRVFGVLQSTIVASIAIGSLLAPLLVAAVGERVALVVTGAFLPLLALLTWRKLSAIDVGATVPAERVEALRPIPFLATLPLAAVERLASGLEPVTVPAGEDLFRRGDEGDRFYIVAEGELEVVLDGHTKVEGPGAWVGEIALLRDVPRTATVRARTDARLWAMEREQFLSAVTGHARSSEVANEVVGGRLAYAPTA
jgi:MFS family permease